MSLEQYKLQTEPVCPKEAVIRGERYRFSVLTPSLIRMEYDAEGVFEDRSTQSVLNRRFAVPPFQVVQDHGDIKIITEYLELTYDGQEFSASGLSIKVNGNRGVSATWHYGENPDDLGGTARTLDMTDGSRVLNRAMISKAGAPGVSMYCGTVDLGHGLISRDGFSLVDDSGSMVLLENGWIEPRKKGIVDLYFFGYGSRYLECLRDFYYLCGSTPLIPRYALGNWWSRYHRYTEQEYRELVGRFEEEKLPFSVAVVDMDWHLVDDVDPKYGSGWTGYTWNRKFFPDPRGFMAWLHEHGMKITLNVHPADGIRAYEEIYPKIAEAVGIDPASGLPVPFDPGDPDFLAVYLKVLNHTLEEEGVDFWWIDWQQGEVSRIPGLDPLWILNHYHYLDSSWKGTRPLTFSRYAGVGSHRYPIGFSGDTVISWESLQYQPYFTSTASNIGYGWWSHDIGGHMFGVRDDELMARWIQFGVFSPINRLHSTDNPFNGKEPWKFDRITRNVMNEFLRLRHALIPYLYTMNRRAHRDGIPLILPMYYLAPQSEEAYGVPNEYCFGSELLVSPVTEKMDSESRTGCAKTWLPEGMWADFFTGVVYHGGRTLEMWRGLETIPVLMKAGAIVPMKDMEHYDSGVENPEALEIRVFPAADGSFTLWEDAGDTPEDLEENWAHTDIRFAADSRQLTIEGAGGNLSVIPERRTWKIVFAGVKESEIRAAVDGTSVDAKTSYDAGRHFLTVRIPDVQSDARITVSFVDETYSAENDVAAYAYDFLEKAQIAYGQKQEVMNVLERGKDSGHVISSLRAMRLNDAVFGKLCELADA